MSNPNMEVRTTEMYPEDWEALEALAEELQALAPSGPTAGQPSWRTLVKQIARGELVVTRPEPEPEE